jgi:cell division protein FtsW
MHQTSYQQKEQIEKELIIADVHALYGIVAVLSVIGLIFIYSASSVYALERTGSAAYFVKKQMMGIVVGLGAFICGRCIPFRFFKRLTPLLFLSALIVTGMTLIPRFAQRIHGSSRWLFIGGFSFQPSELLKIIFIMYSAYLLEKHAHKYSSFMYGFLPMVIPLVLVALILLKQPDFGLTVTLSCTLFMLLFIAHINARFLCATGVFMIFLGGALIYGKAYRLKRIMTFLNPWQDPQGAGFQIIQSLIAIGSGGLYGVGLSESKQKFFYLPMQHTDFIFSIIAEEVGFIGSFIIIFLFILLLYFGMRVACRMNNIFCAYFIKGFVIVVTLQALINVCVATGLFPTKGVGLPFVSYGNSSMVCLLGALGLVGNAAYAEYDDAEFYCTSEDASSERLVIHL